ncbi:putative F-box domain-containing protein [Seiridium cardinale]|uniref:F-box domain-containing protein n=1 Tax=Seiridium cardinale TaxID=138064 RepID=A0ABR2XA12_9PEZI
MAKHRKPRLANDEGKLKTTDRGNRRQSRAPKQSIREFDPADTEISSGPPTLAQRFHALPQELQDEIFAWLLVRQVMWDREHRADCPRRSSVSPYQDVRPWYDPFQHTCVSSFLSASAWRHNATPIWVDPWRSQWAPTPLNPYLCTICYDHRHRPRPFPVTSSQSLPCLCARRDNLHTFLVCKRWYQEAGRVFYSRNTFAFGYAEECCAFLVNLPEKWKPYITKISILTLPQPGVNTETAWEDLKNTMISVDGESGLYETWRQLRKLPALSHLELDALMLTRPDVVRVLRQPALKNLRSIKIAQALPTDPKDYQQYIWSRLAKREDVDDSDFVTDIARAIIGNRYRWIRWTKNTYANKALAERKRYLKRFRPSTKRGGSEKDENDDEGSSAEDSSVSD